MNGFWKFNLLALLPFILVSENALSWGGRGHHAICSSAPHLLNDYSLKTFLKFRPHTMGHLCNIPDIHWKALVPSVNETGSPTHYIDPEVIGLKINEIPLDFQLIVDKYTGTENLYKKKGKIFSIPTEFGSIWWRADQFFRMIANLKSSFIGTEPPKNYKEEQDEKLPYNQAIYNMMVYMGLMGHFVGDASQPFHATANHDGYSNGHGGIHSYYEELVVAQFGPDLEKLIIEKALAIKDKKLLTGTPLEIMKYLMELSSNDKEIIYKLDPVLKKSEIKTDKGMEIKTPALRSPAETGFKKFKDLVVLHMARSAKVLAHFWDEAYNKAGAPSLQGYKSYRYPHTPDFIPPDYVGKLEPKK